MPLINSIFHFSINLIFEAEVYTKKNLLVEHYTWSHSIYFVWLLLPEFPAMV